MKNVRRCRGFFCCASEEELRLFFRWFIALTIIVLLYEY